MLYRGCLLLLAAGFGAGLFAQTPVPAAKFAVEFPGFDGHPPNYVVLTGNGISSLAYDGSLRRVEGAKGLTRQASALKLEYKVEGESVVITATVFFGDFDRQTTPVSLYNLPQERVGSYSAGLNESVTFRELEKYGLEPLTLRVVAPPTSDAPRARTMSRSPSVQMEIVGGEGSSYELDLRNLAAKGVTAFHINDGSESGGTGMETAGGSRVLIAPGARYQVKYQTGRSGTTVNGRYVEDPPPSLVVLSAVLFEDGSYEGDANTAAQMAGHYVGLVIQRARIESLVGATLADYRSDDDAKIARIRAEVGQLTEEPDVPMVERVRLEFPSLPSSTVQWAQSGLRIGLDNEKQTMTFLLKEFEGNRENFRRNGTTLAKWLGMRERP